MTDRNIRVLWTSNIVLPAVAKELGVTPTPFGGWLSLMIERLAKQPGFSIGVAMRSETSRFQSVEKEGVKYFALPQLRSDKFDVAQADCDSVLADFNPDILHIEGAEMRHARRFMSSWNGPKLLSMQGVLNGYSSYELGRLPIVSMLNPAAPRIALTAAALLTQRVVQFEPRLKHERAAMAMADHIMGRTLWDRAQAAALAPSAQYHDCPRILRVPFYTKKWHGEKCERFSIFIGNGASARKGLHVALSALALLRNKFPGVKLYIAGADPRQLPVRSLKRYVGYPVYLSHLIDKLGLAEHVQFTGVLNAEAMAERMAHSHVCLMSSIIENSPNTLGEAMMLGVPAVSAYAGGAPSMAVDDTEVLFYRPDDAAMLALQISRVFGNHELSASLSKAARARARVTHDPDKNLQKLIGAYQLISESRSGEA